MATFRGGVRRVIRGGGRRVLRPYLGAVMSVDTTDPVYALTFDDGPDVTHTLEILHTLEAFGARGTFFMLGEQANRHPDIVERVAAGGHCVANHSWDHQSLVLGAPRRGRAAWRREQILRGNRALRGVADPLFRPPYGHSDLGTDLVVRRAGHQVVGWNVSARDWQQTSSHELAATVLGQLQPGSIVLFHDRLADADETEAFPRDQSVAALQIVLETLDGSFESVTVPELLRRGSPRRSLVRASAPPTSRYVNFGGRSTDGSNTSAGRGAFRRVTVNGEHEPAPSIGGRTDSTDEQVATLAAFSRPDVVGVYTGRGSDLWPCEEVLFDRFVPPESRILDLGVGTGRTTERLCAGAASYVGLDFAQPMVDECIARFPDLEFVQADASDLRQFADRSFDVVVFSFNGLDCLHPDSARHRCIREIRRVLVPGGIALVSEHNPLVLVARPRPWRGVSTKLAVARLARALRQTAHNAVGFVRPMRGHRRDGYYFDPSHGGNWWHAATPDRVRAEFASFGFEALGEPVGVDYPRSAPLLATPWYYYAFRLRPSDAGDRTPDSEVVETAS